MGRRFVILLLFGASGVSLQLSTSPALAAQYGGAALYTGGAGAGAPFLGDSHVTLTMRNERLEKLRGLKQRAIAWQAQDGGNLTDAHRRLINEEVARLLRD